MSLVGVMESWDWHGYKAEVLFWWGLIVPEISIDPNNLCSVSVTLLGTGISIPCVRLSCLRWISLRYGRGIK